MRGVGKSIGDTVFGTLGRVMSRTQEKRSLPVDLLESDDAYLAIFDAPGALSTDIQVRFEDNAIHVRLDRFREPYDDFEMTLPGRGLALDGSVSLPDEAVVDPENATATLKENGTLHVRVPKAETGSDVETVEISEEGESDDTSEEMGEEGLSDGVGNDGTLEERGDEGTTDDDQHGSDS